jgi:hypothetical protein
MGPVGSMLAFELKKLFLKLYQSHWLISSLMPAFWAWERTLKSSKNVIKKTGLHEPWL